MVSSSIARTIADENAEKILCLFTDVGILLTDREKEVFKQGMWAFAKINVDLFAVGLMGHMPFEEAMLPRFSQIWSVFMQDNPEFIILLNRLKHGMRDARRLAEMPHAAEA